MPSSSYSMLILFQPRWSPPILRPKHISKSHQTLAIFHCKTRPAKIKSLKSKSRIYFQYKS